LMRLRLLPLLLLAAVAACKDGPTDPSFSTTNYQVGEEYSFNVQAGEGKLCSEADRDMRRGRVVAITQRAVVIADVNNPAGGYSDAEYRRFGQQFDELVWPVTVANFGEPYDIDENERVVIFFTRAVNELTPRNQTWFVGGFFTARDLFPPQRTRRLDACAGTNYGEILYMLVPDPQGAVNNNVRSKDGELRNTVAVLGHEFQHLINASRRLYSGRALGTDWNEEVWLNEGLSHIAEELLGHGAGKLAPRQNIDLDRLVSTEELRDVFSAFHGSNFDRLRRYYENPDTASLIGADRLATRGAIWQFLRYAADRKGGSEPSFWRGLIDSGSGGLANLRTALGAEPMDWIQDWTVAIYTDDAVPNVAAAYQQPSWNFRSVYFGFVVSGQPLRRYPLLTRTLAEGVETSVSIRAGSAAYLRFRVAPGARAELRTAAAAPSCQPAGPARDLAIGEVIALTGSQTEVVCVNGGAEGGEFAYIPFNAAATGSRIVNVSGTGLLPPAAGTLALADRGLNARADARLAELLRPAEESWEMQLRERELRELGPRVGGTSPADPGGMAPRSVSFQTSAVNELRVSIVRIR
ncbi:MAG TPA: hypothetical protein VGR27_11195, partial [Longimicrobiaceae bacterium]|nr:hypothetical protein [Longimicrobiaceae bacterium]